MLAVSLLHGGECTPMALHGLCHLVWVNSLSVVPLGNRSSPLCNSGCGIHARKQPMLWNSSAPVSVGTRTCAKSAMTMTLMFSSTHAGTWSYVVGVHRKSQIVLCAECSLQM